VKIETDASFYVSDGDNYQRSSALKTLESCSWSYYCRYVLDLPQEDNRGALQGNCCHSFFECLLNPRHKHFFKPIVKAKTVCAHPATERLVKKLIKKNHLPPDKEIFDKIDAMILVGLNTDFFIKGSKIIGREYRFKIKNESPKYNIYGTVDVIALKDEFIIIQDYKSSKMKFSGSDEHSSIQALMYSLAVKKLYPDKTPIVRFIFLQFPENPVQEVKFSDDTLKGFEHYLAATQETVDNFTEKDAYSNFAADKGMPKEGFSGKLMCGFSNKHGELKKDGTLKWKCPFKLAFFYHVLIKDNKIIKSAFKSEELHPADGETIEKRTYSGCPKFRNVINDLPETQIKNFDTSNVLDDLF